MVHGRVKVVVHYYGSKLDLIQRREKGGKENRFYVKIKQKEHKMGPKAKALLEQPIADLPAKRQRRPPKNSDYLVGDEVDEELNKPADAEPARKAQPAALREVWIVGEAQGEGDLKAVSTGRKVQALGDVLIYDSKVVNTGSALAKPYPLPLGFNAAVGSTIWVTIGADAGAVHYVGGVYESEDAAKAESTKEYIHPSKVSDDEEASTLEVVSLTIE